MIIGISGYGGAGKDETFKILELLHGYTRRAFADKLKALGADLLGVPVELFHNRATKSQPIPGWGLLTPDQVSIKLGTEVGRNIHPQVWVRAAVRDLTPQSHVAFTDCRFPNEAAAIKELGGMLIRVNRPGVGPRIDQTTGKPHVSDIALDDYPFDYVIDNTGSLIDLQESVAGAWFVLVDRWLEDATGVPGPLPPGSACVCCDGGRHKAMAS